MILAGLDENGLGPRLGPLVVTGVRIRAQGAVPSMADLREATGLDDSKRVFSPRSRARGETLALGVLAAARAARGTDGGAAASGRTPGLGALAAEVGMRAPRPRPADCPFDECDAALGACPAVLTARPLPRWAAGPADLAPALAALGVSVDRVASVVLCPGHLNAWLASGVSKLAVDLALFEAVASELARDAGGRIRATCGKVGGTDRYAERFVSWDRARARTLAESRASSVYEIDGVGEVSFVRDADATHPAVAIASVVGKYLRELWMDDLARSLGWTEATPSGYHDAATARLVEHAREAMGRGDTSLPPGCLVRIR